MLGTLRCNDADGDENVKKKTNRFYKKNNNFCTFLHDYGVKMPDFTFYRVRKATTKFYFSL